jgi:hypothetical protein
LFRNSEESASTPARKLTGRHLSLGKEAFIKQMVNSMKMEVPDLKGTIEAFERLTSPGVIGFYTHFEATEIFATVSGQELPINILSIFVMEEHIEEPPNATAYLGERFKLRSLPGWQFGIKRSVRPISDLSGALGRLGQQGKWVVGGARLGIGPLIGLAPQFVPPDATTVVPLNQILKNNFWSGSYLIELADPTKSTLLAFFDDPPRLQELSSMVQERLPLSLAGLSDRLGNLVFQIPINIVMVQFGQERASGRTSVNFAWHPKATPRPLRATSQLTHDATLISFASADVSADQTWLPTTAGSGLMSCTLWDDQHQVILAACGGTGFINQVVIGMHRLDPEPRTFDVNSADGARKTERVGLTIGHDIHVGPIHDERFDQWTKKRIYREQIQSLERELRFVHYKPNAGVAGPHEKALTDVRTLLNVHGRKGCWLWDPYLTADDVLRTLFYCSHAGAPLRALSDGRETRRPETPRDEATNVPERSFIERQRETFHGANSHFHGLRLEYRVRSGMAGWPFHDRFMIFPDTAEGALVWSLGTSVNSLGKRHHILQRVDNGQLIADAFQELWTALDDPEHLVWKCP